MTADDFVTWLQGFAELTESPPTAEQWRIIRQRAANVSVQQQFWLSVHGRVIGWTMAEKEQSMQVGEILKEAGVKHSWHWMPPKLDAIEEPQRIRINVPPWGQVKNRGNW